MRAREVSTLARTVHPMRPARIDPRGAGAGDLHRDREREIEHGLCIVASCIVADGSVYMPILERLERELADVRRQTSPAARARSILERYTVDGNVVKAIR